MIYDLSHRTKLRLTGADRIRYLNGQVTNDVRLVQQGQCVYACVTDVKGHIVADVRVHAQGEALYLDAEPQLREQLAMRLERYIIADDVELTDVTDDWQLYHCLHGDAGLVTDRLGVMGRDLWLPVGEDAPAGEKLGEAEYEEARIRAGVPRYDAELNVNAFPQEAGIETGAMSYAKGCYIGQEILSRIRMSGKMPRRLVTWTADAPCPVGTALFLTGGGDPSVGLVTSQAAGADGGYVGLAYVRQSYAAAHSELLAKGDPSSLSHNLRISSLVNR
jgi:tRNA-modifying protein YgfZ